MPTTFKPLNRRYLVKPDFFRGTTLLEIPDTVIRQSPTSGVVVEGPSAGGAKFGPGDRVIFPAWAGTEITLDEKPYLVLSEGEVLGAVMSEGVA